MLNSLKRKSNTHRFTVLPKIKGSRQICILSYTYKAGITKCYEFTKVKDCIVSCMSVNMLGFKLTRLKYKKQLEQCRVYKIEMIAM